MEFVAQLVPLLLTGSLAGLVLAVGLNAEPGDLGYVLKRPPLLARAILAVLVIPPIAAGLLVWWLPLTPAVQAGIMLMAVAPVPPLVPGKEFGIGGRKAYAYGVYVVMALLTVISVPLVFNTTARLFGRDDTVGEVKPVTSRLKPRSMLDRSWSSRPRASVSQPANCARLFSAMRKTRSLSSSRWDRRIQGTSLMPKRGRLPGGHCRR